MDAAEHNWRGLLQEAQQKKGFRPPVYDTSKNASDGSSWRVVIYFDGSVANAGFAQKFEFTAPPSVVRKKEAEKMASKALWYHLSSAPSIVTREAFQVVSAGTLSQSTKNKDDGTLVCDLVYCDFDTSPWIADMIAQFPNIFFVLYSQHYKTPSDRGLNFEWRTNSAIRDCVTGQMIVDIVKQQIADSLPPPVVVCNDQIVRAVLTKMKSITLLADERSALEYFKQEGWNAKC